MRRFSKSKSFLAERLKKKCTINTKKRQKSLYCIPSRRLKGPPWAEVSLAPMPHEAPKQKSPPTMTISCKAILAGTGFLPLHHNAPERMCWAHHTHGTNLGVGEWGGGTLGSNGDIPSRGQGLGLEWGKRWVRDLGREWWGRGGGVPGAHYASLTRQATQLTAHPPRPPGRLQAGARGHLGPGIACDKRRAVKCQRKGPRFRNGSLHIEVFAQCHSFRGSILYGWHCSSRTKRA